MSNIKYHKVRFLPENKVIEVEDRKSIFETILEFNPHNIDLHFACGAEGICRKCKIRAFQQMGPVTPTERGCLSDEEFARGIRLACQARVIQDTTVEILYKMPFTITRMDEPVAGGRLQEYPGTDGYAVAVDLGVNTLTLSLIDLARKRKIAAVTDTNPQIELGADLEQRIAMVEESEINLEVLNEELLLRIDILIEELCRAASIEPGQVGEIVVSGETGMLHLMLHRIWNPLEQAAGAPDGMYCAEQFDIKSSSRARIYALPVISSYAGADMTAAILATRLHKSAAPALLLVLGTSVRAALYCDGRVIAGCAEDCGAFDGVGLRCGMRPETGAVEHVVYGPGGFSISVIGESLPRGICGSGIIEVAAALKRAGLMNGRGDFQEPGETKNPAFSFVDADGIRAFRLYTDEGVFDTDIVVTQEDIYALRRAKARVSELIETLLAHEGIGAADIERVIVSGAIGGISDVGPLFETGLLPPGFEGKVAFVGNAAKQGAQLVLLDRSILEEAEELARTVFSLPRNSGPVPDSKLHFLSQP